MPADLVGWWACLVSLSPCLLKHAGSPCLALGPHAGCTGLQFSSPGARPRKPRLGVWWRTEKTTQISDSQFCSPGQPHQTDDVNEFHALILVRFVRGRLNALYEEQTLLRGTDCWFVGRQLPSRNSEANAWRYPKQRHCFVLFWRWAFQAFASRYTRRACVGAYWARGSRHVSFLTSPSHRKENRWALGSWPHSWAYQGWDQKPV